MDPSTSTTSSRGGGQPGVAGPGLEDAAAEPAPAPRAAAAREPPPGGEGSPGRGRGPRRQLSGVELREVAALLRHGGPGGAPDGPGPGPPDAAEARTRGWVERHRVRAQSPDPFYSRTRHRYVPRSLPAPLRRPPPAGLLHFMLPFGQHHRCCIQRRCEPRPRFRRSDSLGGGLGDRARLRPRA